MREFHLEGLWVRVADDRAELGRLAGREAADALRKALKVKDEVRVVFAAAPSQNETLEELASARDLDWSRVVALHMDEYVGLPVGSPARFSRYLRDRLFDRLPFKAVRLIDEEDGSNVDQILRRVEALLAEAPIDLVCLGVGENGHIAFNDPHVADFNDPKSVKLVSLDDQCRRQQVNDGCFPSFDATPERAITLTIPTLVSAPRLVCAVPGVLKARAVKGMLLEPVAEKCPATILRTRPRVDLFLDKDSFSLCENAGLL